MFTRLDAADLDRRLGAYFTALAASDSGLPPVALDGKTPRGARRADTRAAHLVSVFAHQARLVLGQLGRCRQSNEIPSVRRPLRVVGRVRLLVTVDAMRTQTATAKLIRATLEIALPDDREVEPADGAAKDLRNGLLMSVRR